MEQTHPTPKKRKPRAKSADQIVMKHVRAISACEAKLAAARADVPVELRDRVNAVAAALSA